MCTTLPSRLEVVEQWWRKHSTQLNEMVKRRGFLSHIDAHTLAGIGGSGVAHVHSTVKMGWGAVSLLNNSLPQSLYHSLINSLSLFFLCGWVHVSCFMFLFFHLAADNEIFYVLQNLPSLHLFTHSFSLEVKEVKGNRCLIASIVCNRWRPLSLLKA